MPVCPRRWCVNLWRSTYLLGLGCIYRHTCQIPLGMRFLVKKENPLLVQDAREKKFSRAYHLAFASVFNFISVDTRHSYHMYIYIYISSMWCEISCMSSWSLSITFSSERHPSRGINRENFFFCSSSSRSFSLVFVSWLECTWGQTSTHRREDELSTGRWERLITSCFCGLFHLCVRLFVCIDVSEMKRNMRRMEGDGRGCSASCSLFFFFVVVLNEDRMVDGHRCDVWKRILLLSFTWFSRSVWLFFCFLPWQTTEREALSLHRRDSTSWQSFSFRRDFCFWSSGVKSKQLLVRWKKCFSLLVSSVENDSLSKTMCIMMYNTV